MSTIEVRVVKIVVEIHGVEMAVDPGDAFKQRSWYGIEPRRKD